MVARRPDAGLRDISRVGQVDDGPGRVVIDSDGTRVAAGER